MDSENEGRPGPSELEAAKAALWAALRGQPAEDETGGPDEAEAGPEAGAEDEGADAEADARAETEALAANRAARAARAAARSGAPQPPQAPRKKAKAKDRTKAKKPEPVDLSPLANKLRELCVAGTPWPNEMAEELDKLLNGDVFRLLRILEVRNRGYWPWGPEGPAWQPRAVEAPAQDEFRWRRAQFLFFLSRLPKPVQNRFIHIFSVRLMPFWMKRKCENYVGMTFIPTEKSASFQEGEKFVRIDQVRALVMSARQHWFNEGQKDGMLDVRSLRFTVDPATHRVTLGGNYLDRSGGQRSRCEGAWLYNFAPNPKYKDALLNSNNRAVADTAADLVWAMEQALSLVYHRAPGAPEFPQVMLGFDAADSATLEVEVDSPGLQAKAWQEMAFWDTARRPGKWRLKDLPAIGRKIRDLGECWEDLAQQISDEDADYLLQEVSSFDHVEAHEGLELWPLDLFVPGSAQAPVRRAKAVFLNFTGLMGRPVEDARQEKTVVDRRLARCQVFHIPNRKFLKGSAGGITYDFESVHPMMSHKFIAAE